MTESAPQAVIAIDGPAGAGKSTVARLLAARLGYRYLDSGALYRAVAWAALERGASLESEPEAAALAASLRLEVDCRPGAFRVAVDGRDVTALLREARVTETVHLAARHPGVRRLLSELQRRLAAAGPLVVEGRDSGSVVFPRAGLKVYLDADEEERARRRARESAAPGAGGEVEEVRRALRRRDERDKGRRHSPLAVPAGALVLDTTNLGQEEVVARLLAAAARAGLPGAGAAPARR